jgi:hypothetical protein
MAFGESFCWTHAGVRAKAGCSRDEDGGDMIAVFLTRRDLDVEKLTVYLQESPEHRHLLWSHVSSDRACSQAEAPISLRGRT